MKMHPVLLVLAGSLLLLVAACDKIKKPQPRGGGAASSLSAAPPPAKPTATISFEGVEPEEELILKDLLRVDGVLTHGTQYIVAINGQIVNIGENLSLTARGKTFDLKVLAITEQRILVRAIQK